MRNGGCKSGMPSTSPKRPEAFLNSAAPHPGPPVPPASPPPPPTFEPSPKAQPAHADQRCQRSTPWPKPRPTTLRRRGSTNLPFQATFTEVYLCRLIIGIWRDPVCTLSFVVDQPAQKKPPQMERLQVDFDQAYRPSLVRMSAGMASLCTMMPRVFMLK